MTVFINAVSAVFMLFMLMSVGYILGWMGWLTSTEKRFISRFVVNIAVPANCIVSLLNNLEWKDLTRSWIPLLAGTLSIGMTLVLSIAAAKALKLPKNQWGVFAAMAGVSNTIFIGLPVTIELFGQRGVPALMLYFLPSAFWTQTAAVMLVERSGSAVPQTPGIKGLARDLLTKPPVIGVMIGMGLLVLNWRPPELAMTFLSYISNTVTTLALIYCGFVVYEVGLKNLRLLRGIPAMLMIRLLISPVLCLGVCALFGVEGVERGVFIIIAALPVASQIPVMAGDFGADEEYAAIGACLSMLGCFITVPILMLLVG